MIFTILPFSTLAAESGEATAEPVEQLSADASRGLSPQAGPYNSVPLTLTVSSYAAPFLNGSTGEHSVMTYNATKYISRSTACGTGTNASGSAKARFVGSNEAGWTLVIDVVVGNYSETWTTNARITNKDMSKATGQVTFGMSWNTSGGTSTTIRISGAMNLPTPAPNAPHRHSGANAAFRQCGKNRLHQQRGYPCRQNLRTDCRDLFHRQRAGRFHQRVYLRRYCE